MRRAVDARMFGKSTPISPRRRRVQVRATGCKLFGSERLVTDLASEDFAVLRAEILNDALPVALYEVQRVRTLFVITSRADRDSDALRPELRQAIAVIRKHAQGR